MAINIKNLEERIQKKVHVVDSNTSVDDLTDMVEAALLLTGSLKTYADSSELPTATGSNEKIGFIQDIKAIKFNNGKDWVTTASGEVQTPAGGGGAATTLHQLAATAGYRIGGSTSYSASETRVDKFPFASSTSGSFVSGLTLSQGRHMTAGTMSPTHGYRHAGANPDGTPAPQQDIEKFPFAAEDAFSDVGNLTEAKAYIDGGGTSSPTHGYRHGGWPATNVIDKYSFSTDGNATDVGDLLRAAYAIGGSHSETHGYSVGGYDVTGTQRIQKYAFASDGNSTPVGATTAGPHLSYLGNNAQSLTHGYHVGGYVPAGRQNVIGKFSFSSDGDATDVGDLTSSRQDVSNASSSDGYTYAHGGNPGSSPYQVNVIERFAHNSDGNAADAGDLALATSKSAAVQN